MPRPREERKAIVAQMVAAISRTMENVTIWHFFKAIMQHFDCILAA
jgi:hypothetical protein